MNELTELIVRKALQDKRAWDRKTRKLNYSFVRQCYADTRESMFIDQVTLPTYAKVTKLLRALTKPEDREAHFVPDETFGWLVTSCSEECTLEREIDFVGWMCDQRCKKIWDNEYWIYNPPSQEEIEALGVTIDDLPVGDVVVAAGVVQKSFF